MHRYSVNLPAGKHNSNAIKNTRGNTIFAPLNFELLSYKH